MTQIWKDEDKKAVTKVQVGPCQVVQVKTGETDGYVAVQLGFGEKKEKHINKPLRGHLKGLGNFRYLREFRLDKYNDARPDLKVGDKIDASTFASGDIVKVTATSKGKGFQGVVKRHGFHGQDETHGTKDQVRMPGSIGAGGIAHVFKGLRMPGRMGNERVSITNLEIVDIDFENNIIFLDGSVPGAINGLVMIAGKGDLKIMETKPAEEVKTEAEATAPVVAVKEEIIAEPMAEEPVAESEATEEVKA